MNLAALVILFLMLRDRDGTPTTTPPWTPFPTPPKTPGDPPSRPPPIVVQPPPPPPGGDDFPPDPSDPPPIVVQPPPTPTDPNPPPVVIKPPPEPIPIPPHIPPSDGAHPTLRLGSTGAAVSTWQGIVGVAMDGKFGPNTQKATIAWQRARPPLVADGIVGPKTWERAENDAGATIPPLPPPPPQQPPIVITPPKTPPGMHATIRQGSTGADVAYWQGIIGVPQDGKFGPATKAATVAWQAAHKLTPDGVVGPNTWSAAETGTPSINTVPPPWPAMTPSDLPPFPSGWTFDQPPPQAVQTRAAALLPQLWAKGVNTKVQEKTGGRWITYRAELTGPQKKKGVIAYRLTNPTTSAQA